MENKTYTAKGSIAVCPYHHTIKELTGDNLSEKDIAPKSMCEDSSKCPMVDECPVFTRYNAI